MFYNKDIFKRCFSYRPKYWYKNIAKIPLYFRLMRYLIKHGYDEYATWETFDWFISTMKPILQSFRDNHDGYPVVSYQDKDLQSASEVAYDADLDKMISLLDDMDESNPKYESKEYSGSTLQFKEMEKAKDEFFALFAKHFYSLWD